jgi:hypothetical protein
MMVTAMPAAGTQKVHAWERPVTLTGTTPHPCPLDHIAIDMCEFGGVLHSINELVSATTRSQYILVCHTIPHIRCALPAPGPGEWRDRESCARDSS